MKPQNNELLNNLLSKYSEFEGILHGGKESGRKVQLEEYGAAPEMVAYGVQQKALNILAEISGIVSTRSEGKKHQGKEGEERMSRVISVFLKRYPETQDLYQEELGLQGKRKIAKTVPTMDDLLDEIGVSVGEILFQSQSFIPDIYRTSAKNESDDGIIRGSGNGLEEVRNAPKYEILMQVLLVLGVDPRNVSVTTEKIDPKRMRKYPYKIVHIVGVPYPITLTISDEIGQSTYIYEGYVDLSQFIEAKKGSAFSGIIPEEVVYSENYRERMMEVIERMLRGEEGFGKRKNIERKKRGKEDTMDVIGAKEGVLVLGGEEEGRREREQNFVTNLTPEILRYQAILLSHREALNEAGILEKKIGNEMIWCFDEAKGCPSWPEIREKSLRSFPNQIFNRAKGIGNKDGRIQNLQQLAKMFEVLGLPVATGEEYILLHEETHKQQIPLWRQELLSHREALKEVGIVEKKFGDKMIWCFDEAKGNDNWPRIGEKSLRSFPNQIFNKARGIGNKDGTILSSQELAKMFEVLGLQVATDQEYISLWREELLSERGALRKAGIVERQISNEMIWCFDETKGNASGLKIGERNLKSFPNGTFNKARGIGNKNGTIQNSQELAKMFEVLGLRVATDEEYVSLWRQELLSHREALKEVGIVEKKFGDKMIWCFDEAKGNDNWPRIGGRSLMSFPNGAFNKARGIGNKDGTILSSQELAKMFEVLGLQVATDEEYILLQEGVYEQQIPLWREKLLSHQENLKEVGIVERRIGNEIVWYFDNVKGCDNWPNIGEKNLRSFPNSIFNKTKGIGNKDGTIRNFQELAKMFEALGLRVKHPEKKKKTD